MTRDLIVGSGPAAAGVALALAQQPGQEITVLDIGGRLEPEHQVAVERMSGQDVPQWTSEDFGLVSAQPVAQAKGELPQKRSYGSDYPFRNLGQLDGIATVPGGNEAAVSAAYGGFSNVWGAQVMPFSRSTFQQWPISWDDVEPHYRAVLQEVPLAAEQDDLAELFPLLGPAQPLPQLAPRTADVLRRYERNRAGVREAGVTVGRARIAMRARECVRCGLCMTGCPYTLIYSAAQTFDRLRDKDLVRYIGGLVVHRIGQTGDGVFAWARDVTTGERHEFRADRLFVAAGGLGTTRLVLGSLAAPPPSVSLGESIQFVLPFLSGRSVDDPRTRTDWTLNQFNVLLDFSGDGYDTSQVHFYPYNPAFFDALPAPLRHRSAGVATTRLLRRLTAGLGYLPSWASPRVRVTHRRVPGQELPALSVDASTAEPPAMYGDVLRRLLRVAPKLDLWPVVPAGRLSGPAKSYHFGGSFPHAGPGTPGTTATDRVGRLPEWDRIHLVDGSVLPSVPSTTFTLTVMANAHRIATESLALGGENRD